MDASHPARTIAVTGQGKVSITPDEANIQAGVQATVATAREASTAANQAMIAIIAAFKDGGVAENAIQTGYFIIRPEIEHYEGKQQRIGHTASNSVNATVTAVATLGALLDAVIDAGGDYVIVNNVAFAASEPLLLQAQEQARQMALVDALHQAEMIAQTVGITLGSVQSIQVIDGNAPRRLYSGMAMRAGGAGPAPIQSGELDITDSVHVIYAIAE